MFNAEFLQAKFQQALSYPAYLATGNPDQQHRWGQVYDAARLTQPQQSALAGFVRSMNVLVVSGIWCGDCVQQCPLMQRIAEGNAQKIALRLLDRDQHRDLIEPLRLNGGDRVPVVLFLAEDFQFCGVYGDRTLNRYRALAERQLGPSCPTGLIAPGKEEMAATVQDWLNEFERVQLMLRLSARLRQKHGD